ncbi:MAG: hypothetical protein WCF90_02235 [Methanomicrobiales archaeon]
MIEEIAIWHYAGFSAVAARNIGAEERLATDDMFKKEFNQFITRRFDSRIDFMFEILKSFSLETAALKIHTFKFFVERYHLADNVHDPLSCDS